MKALTSKVFVAATAALLSGASANQADAFWGHHRRAVTAYAVPTVAATPVTVGFAPVAPVVVARPVVVGRPVVVASPVWGPMATAPVTAAPVVTNFAPAVTAPVTTAAPVTSFYAPATTAFFAPAPTTVVSPTTSFVAPAGVVAVYPYCGRGAWSRFEAWDPAPPALALIAGADTVVDAEECARLFQKMKSAGGEVELVVYEGVDHVFDDRHLPEEFRHFFNAEAQADAERRFGAFLDRLKTR